MGDYRLVVKLDQYAGNVDEIVCVALTGWGAERHGAEDARKVFDAKVVPLLGFLDDPEYPEMPIEFMQFSTDYGQMPYELDGFKTNNLRIGIDTNNLSAIQSMIDIWKQAYGDDITIVVPVSDYYGNISEKSVTVKVLGFDFIEIKEVRTEI